MIKCDRVEELLGAWLDGELSPGQVAEVRGHVDGCESCTTQKRDLERLDSQLKRALEDHGPSVNFQPFSAAVRARIEEDVRPHNSPWIAGVQSWGRRFSLAWAVPAMIALLRVIYSLAGPK